MESVTTQFELLKSTSEEVLFVLYSQESNKYVK